MINHKKLSNIETRKNLEINMCQTLRQNIYFFLYSVSQSPDVADSHENLTLYMEKSLIFLKKMKRSSFIGIIQYENVYTLFAVRSEPFCKYVQRPAFTTKGDTKILKNYI